MSTAPWERVVYRGECTSCGHRTTFETTNAPIEIDEERTNWCDHCADLLTHRCVGIAGGDR